MADYVDFLPRHALRDYKTTGLSRQAGPTGAREQDIASAVAESAGTLFENSDLEPSSFDSEPVAAQISTRHHYPWTLVTRTHTAAPTDVRFLGFTPWELGAWIVVELLRETLWLSDNRAMSDDPYTPDVGSHDRARARRNYLRNLEYRKSHGLPLNRWEADRGA